MKKHWIKIVLGLVVVFVLIQFIPVRRDNPTVTADIDAPADIKNILKISCYDCHSNETRWPAYSRVAPVSWLVASDVHEAREHMNFSEWDGYSANEQAFFREHIYEMAASGEMPLGRYVLMHPEAKISDANLEMLRNWSGAEKLEEGESPHHEEEADNHGHTE